MVIPIKQKIFFILLFILFGIGYNYQHTLSMFPASKHKWRQSDAYSQTLNYYHENNALLEPKIHLYNSVEGKGAGEFPLLYYVNASIWKLTGESVFLIRFETMLLLFLGLFSLFRLTAVFVNDPWFRLLVPFLVFASPVIAFYGDNYLVNISALSFVFVSWDLIIRGDLKSRRWRMYVGFMVLTLAALLRPTMIIAYLPLFIYFLYKAQIKRSWKEFFSKTIWLFVASTIIPAAWIMYIRYYNDLNNSVYFLTDFVPFWTQDIGAVMESFKKVVMVELYPTIFIFLLLALFVFTTYKFYRLNKTYFLILLTTFLLVVIYFALWFGNFNVHDYYLIEFFVFIPLVFGGYYYLVEQKGRYLKHIRYVSLVLLLLYLIPYSVTRTRIKYATSDAALAPLFISVDEIELWKWSEWYDKDWYQAFEEIRPLLRKHGINRDEIVITFGDPTSNYTLSLMDQKGYTDLYNGHLDRNQKVEFYKKTGAKYLILNHDDLRKEIDSTFTNDRVLKYRNISVYRL